MRLSLTKRGDYGVRIVLQLANQAADQRATSAELAVKCDVPRGNVPTIISTLSRALVLDCMPGPGGGCTLARPAEDISMLEVIEALEGPLEDGACIMDARRCTDKNDECALHGAWVDVRQLLVRSLADLTVAEAAERQPDAAHAAREGQRVGEPTRGPSGPSPPGDQSGE